MGQASSVERTSEARDIGNDDGSLLPQNDAIELPKFQMNPDVWYSVFACLTPLDLLNLARTCKYFRRILVAKSSAFVWKIAYSHVKGLPDCPADMSEPAYADLVYYARCHACGDNAPGVFWRIRRRYCQLCTLRCLCRRPYYPRYVDNFTLAVEYIATSKQHLMWFDKAQVDLLIREYKHASNKKKFLHEKRKQCKAINEHAEKCESWEKHVASLKRKAKESARREERRRSISERLKHLGYEPELRHFGEDRFWELDGDQPEPLTDQGWAQMLPQWIQIMDHHRQLRLDAVVYSPRRRLLISEYDIYVRSPDTPHFERLPHVDELARFPPFRNIIKAPEGTQTGDKLFASAFAQLPELARDWKEQFDAELAELVRIPPELTVQSASSLEPVVSSSATSAGKLRLACARFRAGNSSASHPTIYCIVSYYNRDGDFAESSRSISERFHIKFLEEAPYIVHACGLDPSVATESDMDHRNAYLKCLACNRQRSRTKIMDWRQAMVHAAREHTWTLSLPPQWQLVSDEYTDMIGDVEKSMKQDDSPCTWRCLLCQPRIGDKMDYKEFQYHFEKSHGMTTDDVERNVDYEGLIRFANSEFVEMIEDGGQVRFQKCGD